MNIALYYNLPAGGAKRTTYMHCRGLTEAGHRVTAFQPEGISQEFCDLSEVTAETVELPLEWRDHLRTHLGPPGQLLTLASNYRRLGAMQQTVADLIQGGGFDLAYVTHDIRETAPTLLRLLRIPTVYFCHEPSRGVFEASLVAEGEPAPTLGGTASFLARAAIGNFAAETHVRYLRLNERLNTLAATVVITNSAYTCEAILRAHGRPARRLRLGVDHAFFCPSDAPREDFLLSVGGYCAQKGFRFLIRMLGQVPKAVRPPLVISGDRRNPAEIAVLERLACEHEVNLTLYQAPPDDFLRDLYRRARLFVYAPYLEPLGLTPLEAMACGTPVLGVAEGGVRETVIDGLNGRLAPHHETHFAQVLQEMLADQAGLRRMGDWGCRYVRQEWTWQRSVSELLEAFERALSAKPEP